MDEQTTPNWLQRAKDAADAFNSKKDTDKKIADSREASNRLVLLLDMLPKKLGSEVGQDIILNGKKTPAGYLELDGYTFHAFTDTSYGYQHLRVGKIVEGGYFFMENGDIVNLPSLQDEIDRLEQGWKEHEEAAAAKKAEEAEADAELTWQQKDDIEALNRLLEKAKTPDNRTYGDDLVLAILRYLRFNED